MSFHRAYTILIMMKITYHIINCKLISYKWIHIYDYSYTFGSRLAFAGSHNNSMLIVSNYMTSRTLFTFRYILTTIIFFLFSSLMTNLVNSQHLYKVWRCNQTLKFKWRPVTISGMGFSPHTAANAKQNASETRWIENTTNGMQISPLFFV